MSKLSAMATALLAALVCFTQSAAAAPGAEPFLLGPPEGQGPVVVEARFALQDVNAINDEEETFEFAGVLTLKWRDPRQAFDPAVAGVEEKIYQGNYQFNELSPAWYPQLILANESGMFETSGVVLRLRPDGTSTLIQTINAVAESEIIMRRFPFDKHHLEAVFEVLGFGKNEVELRAAPDAAASLAREVFVPQWTVTGGHASVRDRPAFYAGLRGVSSAFVLSVDVERRSFYILRLVVIPLIIIVLLSFAVFWMDRSSLADRVNVSFVGILTAVAYMFVTSDQLPRISYFTLIHGFLNLSLLTMGATVVINLVVGALDKRGSPEPGDRIDRRCRWIFPLVYFGLLLVMVVVAFLYF